MSSYVCLLRQRPSSSPYSFATFLHFVYTLLSFLPIVTSTGTEGCGSTLPVGQSPGAPSVQVAFQQSNGAKRTYLVHIPENYDHNTATPLIFNFHGRGRNNSYQEIVTGFSRPDWNPDSIVIYPQGINDAWQGDPETSNVDDIGFVSDMISAVSKIYCVNSKRIYATGKSNGGSLVNTLACNQQLSTQIAAFASASAALYIPGISQKDCVANIPQTANLPCSPGKSTIPILEFHGLQDDTIPYNGGPRRSGCLIAIPHWLEAISIREGFGPNADKTILFDGVITKFEYAPNTKYQGILTHYAISGWDHDWPSRSPTLDSLNTTKIDATPIIMEFFDRYTL